MGPQIVMQQQPQMMQPRVIERTIVTPMTQVIRTTIKPVRKQIGTKTVATVQNVETQNAATMKMTTEYAEPYVKRDGYTQVTGYGQQSTKVVRRGKTMLAGGITTTRMQTVAARVMTTQVTRMRTTTNVVPTSNVRRFSLGRGYTRIDTWKKVGDA